MEKENQEPREKTVESEDLELINYLLKHSQLTGAVTVEERGITAEFRYSFAQMHDRVFWTEELSKIIGRKVYLDRDYGTKFFIRREKAKDSEPVTESEPVKNEDKLNIKYMIYISEDYFKKNYPRWNSSSFESREIIRQAITDTIDSILSANGIFTPPEGIHIDEISESKPINK